MIFIPSFNHQTLVQPRRQEAEREHQGTFGGTSVTAWRMARPIVVAQLASI